MCALVTGVQTCALPISFRLDSLFDAGREVRRDALDSTRVVELMSTELVTVDGDVSLTDAIGLMERLGAKRLPVISYVKLVGPTTLAAILLTSHAECRIDKRDFLIGLISQLINFDPVTGLKF